METIQKNNSGDRLTVKVVVIVILMLLLWASTFMIQGLIDERQQRQNEAINEVSSKWGQRQTLSGPIISVPYFEFHKDTGKSYYKVIKYAHFLPNDLKVQGKLFPEKRYRGIYEVVVYNSDLKFSGKFIPLDFSSLKIPKDNIMYDDAFVSMGISDLRGIEEEVSLTWNAEKNSFNAGIESPDVLQSGISTKIKISKSDTIKTDYEFSFNLKLKGSELLYFTPLGKETKVQVVSNWKTPSFDGSFLPDERTVNDTGFTANWKILHLNRNYPQSWIGSGYSIQNSSFGVNLLTPVDNYHKSTRSVKYAILIITLTFLVIFFIEILNQYAVHPLQYTLIGLGLCIFYSLLISISEHTNFNFSYFISGLSTIILIAAYLKSIFKANRIVLLVAGVLAILHGYIFSLIQLEDYALLMGSIGLFITLAIVMFYSRKIDWYNLSKTKK
ncbi:MAG: cell envelope integrity protein CreD [Bacteroidetes bacterium]|nr:cell envelope integrity protein CreD [Bacteroidota bacterium]